MSAEGQPKKLPVYLDCNATTPIEPSVRDVVLRYMEEEFGNAGSRTHEYGLHAQQAVQIAREQVASVVGAKRDEVTFTSGATESNNLALLGLQAYGERTGRKHVITTAIEHKAVLEPVEVMRTRGFDVSILPVSHGGRVDPNRVAEALRPDTLIVSVMHVNNETGVVQPLDEIAKVLSGHECLFHTDAAQGFGREPELLRLPRIDMLSISGHKIYGPKGVGALIARRRGFLKLPLEPLMFGGGQERGLRPGTLPVALVVGLGHAAELCAKNATVRRSICVGIREAAMGHLAPLIERVNGDERYILPHVLNVSFKGVDSEAAMVALRDLVAISNGSACTSQNYQPSHVLTAMGLAEHDIRGALRISWCHMTEILAWADVAKRVSSLR